MSSVSVMFNVVLVLFLLFIYAYVWLIKLLTASSLARGGSSTILPLVDLPLETWICHII